MGCFGWSTIELKPTIIILSAIAGSESIINEIYRPHNKTITSLIFLDNGLLLSASDDKTIKLWDHENKINLKTFIDLKDQVKSLALLPSGLVASGSYDKTVKIWDIDKGECLETISCDGRVEKITVSPAGRIAVTTNKSLTIYE